MRIKEGEPIYRDAGSISILQEVGMICLLNVEFLNIICMTFLFELVINDSLMFLGAKEKKAKGKGFGDVDR